MADIKISELTAALTVSDADVLPMTASGSTVKVTTALLKEHAIGDTDISGVGDGSVTGAIDALDDEDTTIKAMVAPTETSPTANSWTTGAQFIYNDVLYDVIADITVGDALTVGTNISPADTVVEQIEDAVADIATNTGNITLLGTNKMSWLDYFKTGVHNILVHNALSQTLNGITFTVNDDRSITWSGKHESSTSNIFLTLLNKVSMPAGKYKLSGCPVGGSSSTYKQQISIFASDGTTVVGAYYDYGDGVEFTIEEGQKVSLYSPHSSATNYNNNVSGTFKPMITVEGDIIPDYAKGAMTNSELTEAVTRHTNEPMLLATAAANQTWAAQLTALKATYDTLTNPQKTRCFISVNGYTNSLYRVSTPNVGDFSAINMDSSGNVYTFILRISSSLARRIQTSANGTVTSTDLASTTHSYPLMLYLE